MIDFIVRRSVPFAAREQPCVYPVVSVELGEALVRRRAARSPYTALCTPSSGEGLKSSARGGRHANTHPTRAKTLAVEAKARRTPSTRAQALRETPRRDAIAATARSHRRFATQVRHGLNTFGSARRDQTATDVS